MIRNSFIILNRIGASKERSLWRQGILTWEDFINQEKVDGISRELKRYYDRELELANFHLEKEIPYYFSYRLPAREHWRLYEDFKDKACFLDIETSGLKDSSIITVVSLFDGRKTKTFIRGINLEEPILREELSKYLVVVTYYGSVFDIPFIHRCYPSIRLTVPHLDLCFLGRRIGLCGGLKKVERDIGIIRNEEIEGITGVDAVRLWKRWSLYGDRDSLELLVEYNQADVVNLKPLAELMYERMKKAVFSEFDSK
jgi:hypothetical protein